MIGNAALLDENGIDSSSLSSDRPALAEQGKTPVFVRSTVIASRFSRLPIRPGPGASEAIALLHRLGLKTVMATGDVDAVANHVAREVGIDRVIAAPRRPTNWPPFAICRRPPKKSA
jgi:Cu+-exporting ATPase